MSDDIPDNQTVITDQLPVKSAPNYPDPVITDLNLLVATMKMSGKRNADIARELGVTDSAVCQQLNKFKVLANLKAKGEITDPINASRARISNKLRKFEKVIDYTVRPSIFKRDVKHLAIAAQTSIAGLKGLGVLVDRQETTHTVDVIATARESAQQRFAALQQFRYDPNRQLADVEAEIIEAQAVVNQPANSDQVSAADPTVDIDPIPDRPA